MMLTMSHYQFKEMLRMKLNARGGRLIDCTEEYSSKTCTLCGRINYKLKSEKVYKCTSCPNVMDRDVNAARNIFLMNSHMLTYTHRV